MLVVAAMLLGCGNGKGSYESTGDPRSSTAEPANKRAPEVEPAAGPKHENDQLGYAFNLPEGWNGAVQRGFFFATSEAEPDGLLIVNFEPAQSIAELDRRIRESYSDASMTLTPIGEPQAWSQRGNPARAIDFDGQAADGSPLKARAVYVVGAGGTLVILGVVKPEGFGAHARRVDAVGLTVDLSTSVAPSPIAELHPDYLVNGWLYLKTRYGSGQRKLILCPDGSFFDSAYDTSAGSRTPGGGRDQVTSSHTGAGQWSASGSQERGQVTLRFRNGRVELLNYRFHTAAKFCSNGSCDLQFNGRDFFRDGTDDKCQ